MVAGELLRCSTPYVPFDLAGMYPNPGYLSQSGHIENVDEVVWKGPYARHLYYHPEFNFQGAPMRGAYWVDRFMQNGGEKHIEWAARKAVKK